MTEKESKNVKANNTKMICITVVLVVLILAAAGVVIALQKGKTPATPTQQTTLSQTDDTTAGQTEPAPAETLPASEAQPTATTEAPQPTQAATQANSWETAPADKLYRPDKSSFINQYQAVVFCTDVNVQDYVKMRYGPSKAHFDTVGISIDNYGTVTVETKSINGWTLCYAYGTEGWIRSDFIFRSEKEIPAALTSTTAAQRETACAGAYAVHVTGDYAGEPLNMRAKPDRTSALITTVPDGTTIWLGKETPVVNGWVQVTYSPDPYADDPVEYEGYILYQYLEHIDGEIGDKPVLYLYPEAKTEVQVKIKLADTVRFGCTYPAYQDGWQVTAMPDGTLINRADGLEYSYLFWDLLGSANYDFSSGFVVKGEDTAAFLQKTLAKIGLTPREANEFIVYWLPKMQNNAYNLISFQTAAYTDSVQLDITPQPDSLLRVFMAYRKLDKPVSVPEQTITPFERRGFAAVEWGGAEVE